MAPRETVVVEAPPSYPGGSHGYGTIEVREVHHHHHHVLRTRRQNSACCRAILLMFIIVLLLATFGAIGFIAWNFYNLSECEKNRMPWEKPCKNWLGGDGHHRG